MTRDTCEGLAVRFMSFCQMFETHFQRYRKDMSGHARDYLGGRLDRAGRQNLQGIEKEVVQSDYQGMQHFLSGSPWDHADMCDRMTDNDPRSAGWWCARSPTARANTRRAILPEEPRGIASPSSRPGTSRSNAPSKTPTASLAWPTTNCTAGPAGTITSPWSVSHSSSP